MHAPKFKIGQIWTDARGAMAQTIVAITDNPAAPIVTQIEDGDVWSYRADGSWPVEDHRFDLVTLVRDVPAADLEVEA